MKQDFQIGDLVSISGLVKAERYNGGEATIITYEKEKDRFGVRIENVRGGGVNLRGTKL